MNLAHAIYLEKVGPFKKPTRMEFKPGISVLYGLNRAAGKASKNSNGVGKSLFTGILPQIIYEEPSVGEKSDRIKSGVRGFEFTNHAGKRIDIRRLVRGKSEKIDIFIDGKDQEHNKLPVARKEIAKLWPLTQAEYSTFVHVDSRVAHPLVMGTGADRKAFMTAFFGLDKMDAERKLYAAALKDLSKIRAAYDELRSQYDKMKEDTLPKEKVELYTERVGKYQRSLKRMQQVFSQAQETLRLVSFSESFKPQIAQIVQILGGEFTDELFRDYEKNLKWEAEEAAKNLEEAEAWDFYKKANANYTDAVAKLSDKTRAFVKEHGLKSAKTQAKNGYDDYMSQRAKMQAAQSSMEEWEEAADEKNLPEEVAKPTEDEIDLQTLKRTYEHALEHAEKFSEGKCETCGQPVQIKDPKVIEKKLKAVIEKLKAFRKFREYEEAHAEYSKAAAKYATFKSNFEAAETGVNAAKPLAKMYKELQSLPNKPQPFEGKKLELKVMRRLVDEIKERRSLVRQLDAHVDSIVAALALTNEEVAKVKEAEAVGDRMSEIQEKLSDLSAKLELHKRVRSRMREARERMLEMETKLKDEEALKHLVNGFADKNIKKMAIEAISQRLMVLVNRYAAMVFPEAFRFEFVWESDIKILVHRPTDSEPTDVRTLSGAESTIFTLIMVCALLNFVPEHKRCSFMILDEPSARMSPEMTEVMYNMVKILNTIVPSIILVTPKEEIYPDATPYTVVKDAKGNSQIVPGFPHQVK